jgi:hypothetical protein
LQEDHGHAAATCRAEEGHAEMSRILPAMLSGRVFRVSQHSLLLPFGMPTARNVLCSLWSCQAAAELRLISQKAGVPNFTRKTSHVYTAKENDWGYSCFMTWAVSGDCMKKGLDLHEKG